MSSSATVDRPLSPERAYTLEAREADIRKFLDHQMARGELGKVKPGFVAGTYGGTLIPKSWVVDEIRKRCELGGDYGK